MNCGRTHVGLYTILSYIPARKRFFKNVTVAGTNNLFEINLDHRKLKTPSGNLVQVTNCIHVRCMILGICSELKCYCTVVSPIVSY